MPGIWTLLGYVPVREDQTPLPLPSESDIQELYQELNFDPQAAARDPEGSLSLQLEARVRKACIMHGPCTGKRHNLDLGHSSSICLDSQSAQMRHASSLGKNAFIQKRTKSSG